jgi:hypothetical protein
VRREKETQRSPKKISDKKKRNNCQPHGSEKLHNSSHNLQWPTQHCR